MKKAVISQTIDLTEGGCNACGIVKCESYHVRLTDREIPLDGLSVSSLVMTIVLAEGWQQRFEVNMMDEFTVFSKDEKEVKLIEDYDSLTYKGSTSIMCSDNIKEQSEMFQKVNDILEKLFMIEGYDFILAEA